VSPTKKARGNHGKETKLYHVTECRKKPQEKLGSVGGPVLLWPTTWTRCHNDSGSITNQFRLGSQPPSNAWAPTE